MMGARMLAEGAGVHPIERYRRGKGLTQADLAKAIGVSMGTVQRWETGAEPRPSSLHKAAQVLGVDTIALLDELLAWREASRAS